MLLKGEDRQRRDRPIVSQGYQAPLCLMLQQHTKTQPPSIRGPFAEHLRAYAVDYGAAFPALSAQGQEHRRGSKNWQTITKAPTSALAKA